MQIETSGALQVVTAAVTPVVMISATAILISGVNARYISISDRIRTLAREHRDSSTPALRNEVICRELIVFQLRIHLVAWAIRALYAAVFCFVMMVLLISATLWRQMLTKATLPMFLTGIALIVMALVCQIWELQESNKTICLEMQEVIDEQQRRRLPQRPQ